jgi:hypothetical protein
MTLGDADGADGSLEEKAHWRRRLIGGEGKLLELI